MSRRVLVEVAGDMEVAATAVEGDTADMEEADGEGTEATVDMDSTATAAASAGDSGEVVLEAIHGDGTAILMIGGGTLHTTLILSTWMEGIATESALITIRAALILERERENAVLCCQDVSMDAECNWLLDEFPFDKRKIRRLFIKLVCDLRCWVPQKV
jgi:hypothetical protein